MKLYYLSETINDLPTHAARKSSMTTDSSSDKYEVVLSE